MDNSKGNALDHQEEETAASNGTATNTIPLRSGGHGLAESEAGRTELASSGVDNQDGAGLEKGKDKEDVPAGSPSPNGMGQEKDEAEDDTPRKPSKFKLWWTSLGLDLPTLLMMFKASLPPTIAISWYQATPIDKIYSTLGYLVPIISVLSMCIMPRAKYLQTLILNVIGVCIGSAIALLGLWSGIQARLHTTPPGSKAAYNSSQAAVCAIWLFFTIYLVNMLRAKIPALQFPAIMFSIFTNVAFTFGPIFTKMSEAEAIIKELLEGFLTAMAVATGVSLFIFPVSSRTVVSKEYVDYIQLIRGTIQAQIAYLQSLETSDMFSTIEVPVEDDHNTKMKNKKALNKINPAETPAAKNLKSSIAALTALHGKLHADIAFAKREVAWGKLSPKDLDKIFELFRGILIPLSGMSCITDIFERIAERRGWVKSRHNSFDRAEAWEHLAEDQKAAEKKLWNEIMKSLHEPFAVLGAAMGEGMLHAGFTLEILPRPKKKTGEDIEASGNDPRPGDVGFAQFLDQKLRDFYSKRGTALKTWAREKGLSEGRFDTTKGPPFDTDEYTNEEAEHRRDQQQLYIILYMENLLWSTGKSIMHLIKFADSKVEDGTMKKSRLIAPGQRRIKKWILNIGSEDSAADTATPDSLESGSGASNVYMGSGFAKAKDPEHLPPTSGWQRFGNRLRTIPRILQSVESAFGFRVACATLSIGIIAFLEKSLKFFIEQRLVWAMIIVAIGMTMTSGQSMFGFFGRLAGTFGAAVASYIIWYICDQKTAGAIVFCWLFLFIWMYFFLKVPRFLPIFLVIIVTQVLIIGYELQVKKIGIAVAQATGQPFYPTYKLAPYRLACVAAGTLVSFFWTIFPYPLSDRSWLRKDLGTSLHLLANFYSLVHSTVQARINGTEGDMSLKTSPGRQLEKARHKIFGKLMMVLPQLKLHSDFTKFEIALGGKFPKDTYDAIIQRTTNITNYLTLVSFASQSLRVSKPPDCESTSSVFHDVTQRQWIHDLSILIDGIDTTSQRITSTLALLSASVANGRPLPPFMQVAEPYDLSRRLEALDKGILDSKHVYEPGYSAYACLQVASALITDDLARLTEDVKDLVGETDFTFTVSQSESSSLDQSSKGKRD